MAVVLVLILASCHFHRPPPLDWRGVTIAGIPAGATVAEIEAVLGPAEMTPESGDWLGIYYQWSRHSLFLSYKDGLALLQGNRIEYQSRPIARACQRGPVVATTDDFPDDPASIRGLCRSDLERILGQPTRWVSATMLYEDPQASKPQGLEIRCARETEEVMDFKLSWRITEQERIAHEWRARRTPSPYRPSGLP